MANAERSALEESTYTYRVTALDAAGNESARSAALRATRRDSTAPPAVTGLTVTPTGYGFSLAWDPNPAPDLGRYLVYRGRLLGDEEKVCSVHEVAWLSAATTSYEYATLPDGEEACFLVDAYDDNWLSTWKWTGEADIVVATELDVTPSVTTPEGSPLELDASATEGGAGIDLDWLSSKIPYVRYQECVHCGLCTASCPTYIETCNENETVSRLMARMTAGKFRHIPVVERGRVVGGYRARPRPVAVAVAGQRVVAGHALAARAAGRAAGRQRAGAGRPAHGATDRRDPAAA